MVEVGIIAVIGFSVSVSVLLAEIRLRKQTDKLWKKVNENTMRLNRIQVMRTVRSNGNFGANQNQV